ncbi:hypothetical protein Ancab_025253 [Ancistrocladus abbreviatus]
MKAEQEKGAVRNTKEGIKNIKRSYIEALSNDDWLGIPETESSMERESERGHPQEEEDDVARSLEDAAVNSVRMEKVPRNNGTLFEESSSKKVGS